MKKIPLFPRSKKLYALVDDADYERVKDFRWYAARQNKRPLAYRVVEADEGVHYRYLYVELLGQIPRGMVVNHKNHDPLDCRHNNLRVCTQQQNMWNRSPRANKKYSRYKCVNLSWYCKDGTRRTLPKPWSALVVIGKQRHHRGMFADEKEAYEASVELMTELHGEFACIQSWQGYSDNPELRKLLGRKNGPPDE